MPQYVVGVKGFVTINCVLVTDLQTTSVFSDDRKMLQKMGVVAVVLTAGFLIGCGMSTMGPDGSKHQTQTGVSETGYPGGQPVDAESPALATSTEQKYARAEPSADEPVGEVNKTPGK
jgi:hypothetical protein